jgi:hypothetical protein
MREQLVKVHVLAPMWYISVLWVIINTRTIIGLLQFSNLAYHLSCDVTDSWLWEHKWWIFNGLPPDLLSFPPVLAICTAYLSDATSGLNSKKIKRKYRTTTHFLTMRLFSAVFMTRPVTWGLRNFLMRCWPVSWSRLPTSATVRQHKNRDTLCCVITYHTCRGCK